jgi:hypothetical protein
MLQSQHLAFVGENQTKVGSTIRYSIQARSKEAHAQEFLQALRQENF